MAGSYWLAANADDWNWPGSSRDPGSDPTHMQPTGSDPPPSNDGDIIVTGWMHNNPSLYQFVVWGWASDAYYAGFARRSGYNFVDYGGMLEAPPQDEDVHKVDIMFDRPLTASEKAAYDKLVAEVVAADKIIASLPSDARIKMPDGTVMTGAQLKEVWSKVDFKIYDGNAPLPTGEPGGNQTAVANWNSGDPEILVNIAAAVAYAEPGVGEGRGLLWMIFHEVGHLTENGRALNQRYNDTGAQADSVSSERYASDFARLMTEHHTGTSVDFSSSANPNQYSSSLGTIEVQGIQADPPANIPWWKFDSVDGSLVPVVL